MLRTLEEFGFVSRHGNVYRVGPQCFTLGNIYHFNADLQHRAAPIMQSISKRIKEVVQLGVMYGRQVLYLERVQPQRSVTVSSIVTRPGSTRPAYCTALGKAILASKGKEELYSYLQRVELSPCTPATITTQEALIDEIELTRSRGYSLDDCETDSEIRCIGAAIVDGLGQPKAALSISTPQFRMPSEAQGKFGALVREAAEKISKNYKPNHEQESKELS